MKIEPVIEVTADGSHTLFVPEMNEHYHSVNGAVQESTHIFINAGLHHCPKDKLNILEIGFGTGLNVFLTLLDIKDRNKVVNYTTLEAYPLSDTIVRKLNYPEKYLTENRELFYKLHAARWGEKEPILPDFYLTKIEADLLQFDFSEIADKADVIYFDAFAPDKQPEMWTQEIFNNLFSIMNNSGILVTYCAKGQVRRMMQQAGFTTERLPGPPGKREMLRATRND